MPSNQTPEPIKAEITLNPEDLRSICREIIADEFRHLLDNERLLTSEEVAEIFKVQSRTICQWKRDGLIPFVEMSETCFRFRLSDVRKLIEQRTRKEESAGEWAQKNLKKYSEI